VTPFLAHPVQCRLQNTRRMQRSKMEPVKGCFGRELVVREALSDVIVILDAEYLAPELHVRQLVIALEYNQ